jgi:hypothetical protein
MRVDWLGPMAAIATLTVPSAVDMWFFPVNLLLTVIVTDFPQIIHISRVL